MSLIANLSGIPDGTIKYSLDGARVSCNSTPPALELVEYCVWQPPGGKSEMQRRCPSPYNAYKQWCAPLVCEEVGTKPPYLQAMQIMAAIGGIYSIITLFIIGVFWRLFVALLYCGSAPHEGPIPTFKADASALICPVKAARNGHTAKRARRVAKRPRRAVESDEDDAAAARDGGAGTACGEGEGNVVPV
jgi:hypothetical protein